MLVLALLLCSFLGWRFFRRLLGGSLFRRFFGRRFFGSLFSRGLFCRFFRWSFLRSVLGRGFLCCLLSRRLFSSRFLGWGLLRGSRLLHRLLGGSFRRGFGHLGSRSRLA